MPTLVEYTPKLQQAVDAVMSPLGYKVNTPQYRKGRSSLDEPMSGGDSPQPHIYNWQVACSGVSTDDNGDQRAASVYIEPGSLKIARFIEVAWQRMDYMTESLWAPGGHESITKYPLLLTGRTATVQASSGEDIEGVSNVILPCFVSLAANYELEEYPNDYPGEYEVLSLMDFIKFRLVIDSQKRGGGIYSLKGSIYDYGERNLPGAVLQRDAALLAYIDENGIVTQLARGIPDLFVLFGRPDSYKESRTWPTAWPLEW